MAYFSPIFLTTFFFVSGYLFNSKRSFIETIEQRFRTIIIPFLIYGLLNIILSQIISFKKQKSLVNELSDFFLQIRGNNDGLWFLACLFVSTIPFYFIDKHINKNFLLLLSVLILIVNKIIALSPLPWHIQLIAPAVFYMTLGNLFKCYEDKFIFLNSFKSILFLFPVYFTGVTLYLKYFGQSVNFMTTNYIFDGIVITVTGIFLCISISKQIKSYSKLLIFIGSNSLLYFCLHGKVYAIIQKIYHQIILLFEIDISYSMYFIVGVGVTVLTCILLIIPVKFINEFFPWSVGKGFSFLR